MNELGHAKFPYDRFEPESHSGNIPTSIYQILLELPNSQKML